MNENYEYGIYWKVSSFMLTIYLCLHITFSFCFIKVSHDSDMMLLDDGTGVVKVIGCCKIPHMPEKLKHGNSSF